MKGKRKCTILKEIRRDIARANNIPLEIPECGFKGECAGTCPRCDAELRYLSEALETSRAETGERPVLDGLCRNHMKDLTEDPGPLTAIREWFGQRPFHRRPKQKETWQELPIPGTFQAQRSLNEQEEIGSTASGD